MSFWGWRTQEKSKSMKKVELWGYLAPEIEVNAMLVERGFEGSVLGGVDPNPTNPGENPSIPGTDSEW